MTRQCHTFPARDPEQFDALHARLPTDAAGLLAELDLEAVLRWSELTVLREG